MARSIISISLPQWMEAYVQEAIKEDGYDSASEYFRGLIRGDRRNRQYQKRQDHVTLKYRAERERLELLGFHRPGERCLYHQYEILKGKADVV
jgi:Arc/MetJ-type ribon-helix-helix transcriptional regulator